MKTVLITGYIKDFDKKLASVFFREGFNVYTISDDHNAPETDKINFLPYDYKKAFDLLQSVSIDIFIDVSDERSHEDTFNVRTGINGGVMRNLYDLNVIRPMALLEVFLPLLNKGSEKRLCYLTSKEASINETRDTGGLGYKMSKAGLHNFLQITRNVLAPLGYTMRVYDPLFGEVEPEAAAEAAFNYFTRGRGVERGDPLRDDECNLVFRDAYGRQHAW